MNARLSVRTTAAASRSAFSDGGWQERARCRGTATDTFYPPDQARGSMRRVNERMAKQICDSCPVLVPCRRHAIDADEPHGIWGGTTPEERDELRRGGSLAQRAFSG